MMDLTDNIEKLHSTPQGVQRIRKNLGLTCDVVVWCKEQVGNSDSITRTGKNWYVRGNGFVITINAHSYTIITAHKEKPKKDCAAMFSIDYACEGDKPFWKAMDAQIADSELDLKIRDKRGYVIRDAGKPAGVMRYNLMYDIIPFLTLIVIEKAYQKKGFGRQALLFWEEEMRSLGHKMVMTSTQVDEQAQHFYRKLGYVDRGGLYLDNTPYEQAQELFMVKAL